MGQRLWRVHSDTATPTNAQLLHSGTEEGEPFTADSLSEMYRRLNHQYYGSVALIDELIDIEWARIPHFYSSFYVCQYATGIS